MNARTLRATIQHTESHLRRAYVQARSAMRTRDFRRETDSEIRAAVRGLITNTATD